MTRQKNSVKNARISFLSYFLLLILTFFSRKIFIDVLGDNIVGLNSTMINILNFINLSELGIGTAISTSLYKPLFDNNKEKINDIISILGYFYRLIGFVVIGIGLVLALFIPLMFEGKGVELLWVYAAYSAFFLSNLVAYFISYQQTILTADQKYYVVVSTSNKIIIAKVISQIIAIKYCGAGYGTWLAMEVIFGLIFGIWINMKVKKTYPWLIPSIKHGKKIKSEYKEILIKAKQVIPHRISGSILTQTDNILLLILTSLQTITLYTNYSLLMSKTVTIIHTSFNGLSASVGNLIAEGNMDSIKRLFWEFHSMFFIVSSMVAICFYYLVSPFITLWLGSEYLLDNTILILLVFNTFMSIMRLPMIQFTFGYSLFKDTWAPWCETAINLVISLVLGYFWGIGGIMMGTAVSVTFIFIWKPYFFYREIFKTNVIWFWINIIKYCSTLFITWIIVNFISKSELLLSYDNFMYWIINAFILALSSVLILTTSMYWIDRGTRDLMGRLYALIKSKIYGK